MFQGVPSNGISKTIVRPASAPQGAPSKLGGREFVVAYKSQNPHPNVAKGATLGWGTLWIWNRWREGGPDNRVFSRVPCSFLALMVVIYSGGCPVQARLERGFSEGACTVAVRNIPARSRVRAVHWDSISTRLVSPVA